MSVESSARVPLGLAVVSFVTLMGLIAIPLLFGIAACGTRRWPPAPKAPPLYEYCFNDEAGAKIEATVVGGDDGKVVVFHPYLRKTDRNLSLASLAALDRICGRRKESGLLLAGARSERHEYGFLCTYWILENPKQKYCVLPIRDPEASLILALLVRLERLGEQHNIHKGKDARFHGGLPTASSGS